VLRQPFLSMVSVLLGLFVFGGPSLAQEPAVDRDNLRLRPPDMAVEAVPDLDAPIPLNPDVRTGRLPNGMTYYIQKNAWPENRVSLRLAVQAGSVNEDDDQQGLAHFVEHMCFNGSEHFKPGELVKYLESIGARFGPDANAYTSFDETVYMLDLPADRDSLLLRGLDAMGDYAARATLSDEEIEKERGVVLDEWRRGLGSGSRLRDKHFPVLFHGSRYGQRLPIGKPEVIEKASPQRLRDFYTTWYRPERMAIVAVGDVDLDAMEARLREQFADVPASDRVPERPSYEVPPHEELLVSVATDPEARFTSASLYFKRPRTITTTFGDYRDDLAQTLFVMMLNDRLDEQGRRPDADFLNAWAGGGSFARTLDSFTLGVRAEDAKLEAALEAAIVEIRRAEVHGFHESELERAKESLLAVYERAWHEKNRTDSARLVSEYVEHFLNEDPAPGIDLEYQLAQQLLPGLTLDDVDDAMALVLTTQSRVLTVSAPEKEGLTPPSKEAILAAFDAGWAAPVEPWVDVVSDRPLLDPLPEPGRVVASRDIPEIATTVLTLSNGVEVWMKPTDFKNDQVLITSYALGGASLADPADYPEAARATAVVGEAGIGGFKPVELEKMLAGKLVSGFPYIGNYTHGLSGSTTPKDLETALQLLYLTFTKPTDRPEAFEVLTRKWRSEIENRASDPDVLFGETVARINSRDHYMARPFAMADVEAYDFERAVAFYRERFANAADFTFFLVGAFDPAVATSLVERYLGGLPSTGRRTGRFVDRGLAFPDAVANDVVKKGLEPKSRTQLTFFADTGLDELESYRVRAASSILRRRLRETLREEQGATYSTSVGYSNTAPFPGYGTISIGFGSAPERADGMVTTVLDIIETLRRDGPTAEEVASIQEQERRDLEVSEKRNEYWLGSLQTVHMLGYDPVRIAARRDRIDTLSPDVLKAAYVKYFDVGRHTRVTLLPESGVAAKP
jgi:zinc protease